VKYNTFYQNIALLTLVEYYRFIIAAAVVMISLDLCWTSVCDQHQLLNGFLLWLPFYDGSLFHE
jgi:hypothetical protein